jgi:hypothetical protein
MKATLNKKLHERALAIIELIEIANQRIDWQENQKKTTVSVFFNIEKACNQRIESLLAVIERLEKAYIETVNRINKAI